MNFIILIIGLVVFNIFTCILVIKHLNIRISLLDEKIDKFNRMSISRVNEAVNDFQDSLDVLCNDIEEIKNG